MRRQVYQTSTPVCSSPRDWAGYPAIVERDTAARVIALGDVHGAYPRMVRLLSISGLIASISDSRLGYRWSGGDCILVCTGDLIDKGDQSIEVLDLMMELQVEAPKCGGEVIVTMGNHEAGYLADPGNLKAAAFRAELDDKGIDSYTLQNGGRNYREWMSNLPCGARINDWFFAHAGNTSGKTLEELSMAFVDAIDNGDWTSPALVGPESLLESRKWWAADQRGDGLLDEYLDALGVDHIVFGHCPGAFDNRGQIGHEADGRIFLIDVGMSPAKNYSRGALLSIEPSDDGVAATIICADGTRKQIWWGVPSSRSTYPSRYSNWTNQNGKAIHVADR